MSASDPLVTIRYCHTENHTESDNLLKNFKPSSLMDYNRFKNKMQGPYRNPLVLIGETVLLRRHLHIKLDVHLNQVRYRRLFIRGKISVLVFFGDAWLH